MFLCDYGCGQPAVREFKSGKCGCSDSPNKCPKKRADNAAAIKRLRQEKGDNYWHAGVPHGTGIPTGKKGKTFKEIHGEDKAKAISQKMSNTKKGKPCYAQTAQGKLNLSKKAKERGLGGYVPGSGRGKQGRFKGIWCDSSWELAYVIYSLDHLIPIQRATMYRYYEWQGKIKKYYPDFEVNGKIVEIKGYDSPQWQAKISANPDIVVLYYSDLKPILDYVINTYGKDYIRLYE